MVAANLLNNDPKQCNRLKKLAWFLAVSIIIIVLLFLRLSSSSSLQPETKTCLTKSCIKAANMLLENMDQRVNPCDDFYQFACGGYINNARINEKSSKSLFNDLSDKVSASVGDLLISSINVQDIEATVNAKKLFKSCYDEDKIEQISESKVVNFTLGLGGWPLLNPSLYFNSNKNTSIDLMHSLFKIGINPLFNVYVTSKPNNPGISMLRISQANWFLLKEYYEDESMIKYYKKMITNVAKLMNSSNANLDLDVDDLFNLEKSLANFTLNQEMRRRSTFKQMSLKELSQHIPFFNWTEYISNKLFANITNVNENEQILVYDWDYLYNASKLYQQTLETQKKTLDNLFIWTFIRFSMEYLPKKYNSLYLDYKKTFKTAKLFDSRLLSCVDFVTNSMPFIVGRIYVDEHFDRNSRDSANEMIKNIINEFRIMLFENDWMDYISKKSALDKADSIDVKIGYPDYTFIDYHLNYIYKDYVFNENEYFENSILINRLQVLADQKSLHKPVELRDWKMSPAEVNAYYSPQSNEICFPAGILQAPFFDSKSPKYLNYGGIGSVIGHEITHGFDDRGRMYDKSGIYHPDNGSSLWSNSTIEKYKAKAQCIIDQYSAFNLKQINRTINGYQTQGENIADNGGIKESFRAYKRWSSKQKEPEPLLPGLNYTQDQLFFINFGQVWCGKWSSKYLLKSVLNHVHSNGQYRVIGATSNMNTFGQVFNCAPKQRMNPVKRCSVW